MKSLVLLFLLGSTSVFASPPKITGFEPSAGADKAQRYLPLSSLGKALKLQNSAPAREFFAEVNKYCAVPGLWKSPKVSPALFREYMYALERAATVETQNAGPVIWEDVGRAYSSALETSVCTKFHDAAYLLLSKLNDIFTVSGEAYLNAGSSLLAACKAAREVTGANGAAPVAPKSIETFTVPLRGKDFDASPKASDDPAREFITAAIAYCSELKLKDSGEKDRTSKTGIFASIQELNDGLEVIDELPRLHVMEKHIEEAAKNPECGPLVKAARAALPSAFRGERKALADRRAELVDIARWTVDKCRFRYKQSGVADAPIPPVAPKLVAHAAETPSGTVARTH